MIKSFEEIKREHGLKNGHPVTISLVERIAGLTKEQLRPMLALKTENSKALWEVGRVELSEFEAIVGGLRLHQAKKILE